jgi:RNA polymerase sigma factor (sigma-70 family)
MKGKNGGIIMQVPVQNTAPGFETAVQPYLSQLKRYCRSLTRSKWDGDDLMQETLLKAIESWSRKRKPLTQAYLRRIASNAWIDVHRKRKPAEDLKQDMLEFGDTKEALKPPLPDAMELILEKLTPKQRITMIMTEGFGYTAEETADLIDSTEGAVKVALHRARKKLRTYGDIPVYHERSAVGDSVLQEYVEALRNGNSEVLLRIYFEEAAAEAPVVRIGKMNPIDMGAPFASLAA